MLNWLGQDLQPGDVVYRGARDGNSSSFKIGKVHKLNPAKGSVTVEWKFQPWAINFIRGGNPSNWVRIEIPHPLPIYGHKPSRGTSGINSLVKVDSTLLDNLARFSHEIDMLKSRYQKIRQVPAEEIERLMMHYRIP